MSTRSTPAVTIVNKKLRLGKKADVAHFGIRRGKNGVKPHLLPTDVLSEIAKHLKPMDILNLARTSRPLRSILMSRKSAFIWKESLSGVEPGVPSIPADMSIPAMVCLAFGMQCQVCDTPFDYYLNENNIAEFELQMRFCLACSNQQLVCLNMKSPMYQTLNDCLPTAQRDQFGRRHVVCLSRQYIQFHEEHSRPGCDQKALIKRKSDEVSQRKEFMGNWEDWHPKYKSEVRKQMIATRNKRCNDIQERLKKLGYDEELEYLRRGHYLWAEYPGIPRIHHLMNHETVNKFEELTDDEWANIRQPLCRYMDHVHKHLLFTKQLEAEKDRKRMAIDIFTEEVNKLPRGSLVPSFVDVYEWEPVRRLIKRHHTRIITEEKIRHEIQANIDGWITEFRENQRSSLRRIIGTNVKTPLPRDSPCPLELATTTLICSSECCDVDRDLRGVPLLYPEFLHHWCSYVRFCGFYGRQPTWEESLLDEDRRVSAGERLEGCRQAAWSAKNLRLDVKAQTFVRKIVVSCGLNPETATVADMDQLDARLVCLTCSYGNEPNGERSFAIYTWRSALAHRANYHWGSNTIDWQKISDVSAQTARTMEAEAAVRNEAADIHKIWSCIPCGDRWHKGDAAPRTLLDMEEHCRFWHRGSQEDLLEGRDYYRSPEAPPPLPMVIRMIPSAA